MARVTKTRLAVGGALTALGIAAVTFVGGWEGKRNEAYLDIVGVPTICFGSIKDVRLGMKKTDKECEALLLEDLIQHEAGMRKCLTNPDGVPAKVYGAALSLTFNVGVGNFCNSTMRRMMNAGRWREACEALLPWNKAGGRVVQGLVNRRKAERTMCLEDAA